MAAVCKVCSEPFPGRGRKQRCDQCAERRICISCGREDVTHTSNAQCSHCYASERTCKECGRSFRGTKRRCNSCRHAAEREQRREYMAKWRDETNANAKLRARHLLAKYGITPDDFDAMVEAQGGRCAVCGCTEPGGRGTWHIDHDHACCPGQVTCGRCLRGLLCSNCNTGLGFFKDNPFVLRSAARYLDGKLF